MNRMEELVALLNEYAYRYYVLDEPIVSDSQYDLLYDELDLLEKHDGIIMPNSPTQRVGDTILKGFESYKHRQRLYSLAKCQSKDEFVSWSNKVNNVACTVEYKYDGLTVNLTYDKGLLVRAVTRGNGVTGEEVTAQAKTIRTIPLSIPHMGYIEIQGECIMRLSELEKYNSSHDIPLKNARNAAAGALRNLDAKITSDRNLDFFAYSVGFSNDKQFETQMGINKLLVDNKFKTGEFVELAHNSSEVLDMVDRIENKRDELDFLIDGAVIKVNDMGMRDELGFTAKAPRWAIAYKYKAEEMSTIIKDVIWQVSRTGKLNPLAILEPIELSGATVSRATLNNLDDIERKDIRIGSKVFVRRSNDVIPEITGVAEHYSNSQIIIPPEVCPSCGDAVLRDGVNVVCKNVKYCGAINISKIEHFVSKDAMDVDGLSEKTIEQLYEMGFIRNSADLYSITAEQLSQAEKFKEKKIANTLEAIEKSKHTTLEKFLYSLGIPNIGKKTAQVMAEHYVELDKIINANIEELVGLPDFGIIMANSVVEFFADVHHQKLINDLLDKGVKISKTEQKSGIFNGFNICLTGKLNFLTRSKVIQFVIDNGGKTSDSVSKAVNLVIVGDEAGSKLDKARRLGIRIMEEVEFKKIVDGDGVINA